MLSNPGMTPLRTTYDLLLSSQEHRARTECLLSLGKIPGVVQVAGEMVSLSILHRSEPRRERVPRDLLLPYESDPNRLVLQVANRNRVERCSRPLSDYRF